MTVAGDRVRYLAAMGIEVWSRRALARPVEPSDAAGSVEASVDSGVLATAPAVPAPLPTDAGAASALRRVLEPEAPLPDPPEAAPVAEAGAATESETRAAFEATAAVAARPPEFRLRVLVLGAGLLIIDEQAVADGGRDRLQRLGDLLRAACLLRGAPAGGRIESQTFFWPQIDAEGVDQSLPRAVEALGAFVRRRADVAGGCLVIVEAPPGLVGADAGEPLAALDALPIARARIDSTFLDPTSAAANRNAWTALCRMGGAA